MPSGACAWLPTALEAPPSLPSLPLDRALNDESYRANQSPPEHEDYAHERGDCRRNGHYGIGCDVHEILLVEESKARGANAQSLVVLVTVGWRRPTAWTDG